MPAGPGAIPTAIYEDSVSYVVNEHQVGSVAAASTSRAATIDLLPRLLLVAGVLLLALLAVASNLVILAAFYRYKRLRTASNCLLVSLAISDFLVGVFLPLGLQLELTDSGWPAAGGSRGPSNGPTSQQQQQQPSVLCVLPYCIVISLCSVSVFVTVAIAVDRLTSLAEPLRYKNIITHSSVERYILLFWLCAAAVGFSPLIYSEARGLLHGYSGSCRFNVAVLPPVRLFLFLAVWAPSAAALLGCYIYVYLVARAHARAIYTVELSFRNQTQTLALPRYGQTLAVTVGAFFLVWLPFQSCMMWDTLFGTNIVSQWAIYLGMPILAHSGANPWIYAFHHGEIRIAALKIAERLFSFFGLSSRRYGCSPARGCSNTNYELADINNGVSYEERRPPVEDYFAAKQHSIRRVRSDSTNPLRPHQLLQDDNSSPEDRKYDAFEQNLDDLTRMLEPEYVAERSHGFERSNFRHIFNPAIRQVRKLNHKSSTDRSYQESLFTAHHGKFFAKNFPKLNTMSDPAICRRTNSTLIESGHQKHQRVNKYRARPGISTASDPAIELGSTLKTGTSRYSEQSLNRRYESCGRLKLNHQRRPTVNIPPSTRRPYDWSKMRMGYVVRITEPASRGHLTHRLSDSLSSSTSSPRTTAPIVQITPNHIYDIHPPLSFIDGSRIRNRLDLGSSFRPCELLETSVSKISLAVPIVQSEPPSPIDPLPLHSLEEENPERLSFEKEDLTLGFHHLKNSAIHHSDPVIPSVVLDKNLAQVHHNQPSLDPLELANLLLLQSCGSPEPRNFDSVFLEHNSRFSSRRPSDSRWSASSRSQEVLPNHEAESPSEPAAVHQRFASGIASCTSYSADNFQHQQQQHHCRDSFVSCRSNDLTGSDLTAAYLDSYLCSSLHDSYFYDATPDSERTLFESFEDEEDCQDRLVHHETPAARLCPATLSCADLIESRSESIRKQNKTGTCQSVESILRANSKVRQQRSQDPDVHRYRVRLRRLESVGAEMKRCLTSPSAATVVVTSTSSSLSLGPGQAIGSGVKSRPKLELEIKTSEGNVGVQV